MNYKVEFSPLASLELQESFDWYEESLAGLGDGFVYAIDKSLKAIAQNPEAFPGKRNFFVNL